MVLENKILTPNKIGDLNDPVNIAILDVENFVRKYDVLPVTSSLILEPSTNSFHEDGLYSETIFGYIGSPDRIERFGYIDLNTTIFQPKIFNLILKLGRLYGEILKGETYAVFDPLTKNFKRVIGDPFEEEGVGTGYSFFMNHFQDLVFPQTESSKRDERIEVIEQYKERALINKYLVEPAGLRDIANDSSGRLVQDDINKLYTSLLLYTKAMPKGTTSPLYDPLRYQIQSKVQEIYNYIENFLDGKRGFIQGSFARRKVAMSTRNVITAAPLIASSPEDPQLLKSDEVMLGVYQTIKGLSPFTKYALNTVFVNPIFKTDTVSQVALTNVKTFELEYTQISPTVRDSWTSSEGQDKLINNFRNVHLRSRPVLIKDVEGQDYALCLVYDLGDQIVLTRSIDDLTQKWPRPIKKEKLRPITYIEMFYLIAEAISYGKHGIVTRYPVIEQGSSYVAELHVVSTTPARSVEMIDLLSSIDSRAILKQYPIISSNYMDAMMVHPSKLAGLGGDRN